MSVNWFTIFGADDVTPIVGAVDADGNVIDPTFSSDIAHPRPWLERVAPGAQSQINLIEGTASIAQVQLTVLDARLDPNDQSSGYVTSLLAGPDGYSRLVMHRAVFQISGPSGQMSGAISLNGVISSVKLNDDLVSYTFQMRDIKERMRKMKLFNKLTGPTPRYTTDQAPKRPPVGPIIGGLVDIWGN